MMWKVELIGDHTDMNMLSDSFGARDNISIAKSDGRFYLSSDDFDGLASANDVRKPVQANGWKSSHLIATNYLSFRLMFCPTYYAIGLLLKVMQRKHHRTWQVYLL